MHHGETDLFGLTVFFMFVVSLNITLGLFAFADDDRSKPREVLLTSPE
jgi:hypothetical protein